MLVGYIFLSAFFYFLFFFEAELENIFMNGISLSSHGTLVSANLIGI